MREDPLTEGKWGTNWLFTPENWELLQGGSGFGPLANPPLSRASLGFDRSPGGWFSSRDGRSAGDSGGGDLGSAFADDLSSSAASIGSAGIGSLLPLLDNSQELDQLGPLFRTLLALQTGGKGDNNDPFSLFSGIQL